jgi:peptidoglycan/LPS O-acetylase OafA/YrhL
VIALAGIAWLVHTAVEKPARRRLQAPRRDVPVAPSPEPAERLVGARS